MNSSDYKILLVDDEEDILEFLGYNLRKEGYKVFTANNGVEGLKQAKELLPHLIILDVMMPEMDGIETCAEIRVISELENTLVVFLSARGEDYSQIAGFDAGADDYITKPIKPKVFVSKIKALLKRYSDKEKSLPDIINILDLEIDKEEYVIRKKDSEFTLPKKEFELIYLLASQPNKVFSRDEIFEKIWGADIIVGDRTIDVHIRKVREKLGEEYIRTVKGVGYKFFID